MATFSIGLLPVPLSHPNLVILVPQLGLLPTISALRSTRALGHGACPQVPGACPLVGTPLRLQLCLDITDPISLPHIATSGPWGSGSVIRSPSLTPFWLPQQLPSQYPTRPLAPPLAAAFPFLILLCLAWPSVCPPVPTERGLPPSPDCPTSIHTHMSFAKPWGSQGSRQPLA